MAEILDKLSIAMLGHKRIPSREGGIEVVVEELSTRMVELGHSVTCYNRRGHHVSGKEFDLQETKKYKGIVLQSVFTIDKKGMAAVSASFMAALKAATKKFDIVHFHAEGPCAMIWIPKLFGKRCICTIHGIDHERSKWNTFAKKYILFGEKCAVKYANEIIVLSHSVEEYFWEKYRRKTIFIPNGVNKPQILSPHLITQLFGLNEEDYILFLGRLVPEKGIRYLIEAFKQVKTDKKLIIAGGTSDTDIFAKEMKDFAKDDERIIFTGFVQGQLLNELFSNTYLYVLPSDLEGMPLSLLEAMSYGNCCLVSDIQECTEVVEKRAIVFKKSNVKDLMEKLQYACDHEEVVHRYKERTANFICKKYNWDNVVERTLEVYKKLVEE